MASNEPSDHSSGEATNGQPLTADRIEQQSFSKSRKGLDEREVRAFLRRVADDFDALGKRIAELEDRLRTPPLPSREHLVGLVGEEVARTLRSAEESARQLEGQAREKAERIERAAHDDANRIRDGQLERATQDASAIVESARERGREMVAEARALRERVIADLNRRRDMLRSYVEQLRADRDRFAEAYRVVRDTVSDANEVLTRFGSGRPFPPLIADAGPAPAFPSETRRRAEPATPQPAAAAPAPEADAGARDSGAAAATGIGLGELPGQDEPAPEPAPVPEPEWKDTEDDAVPEARERAEAATSEPEQEPEREKEPEPEPEPAAPPERERERARAHQPKLDMPGEPEPAAASERASAEDSDVDALFARIRAGRVEAAAKARADREEQRDEREPSAASAGRNPADTAVLERVESEPRPDAGADTAALGRRDELLTPVAHDLTRRCKRVLQDEQNEVLDALRRQRGRLTSEKLLPPLPQQVANWAEVMAPAIIEAYVAARAAASPNGEAVSTAPQRMVTGMVEVLVAPLRERLLAAVDDTLAEDAEPEVIAQRIGARYREWRGEELDSRIGDLLAAVYARGVYDAAPEGSRLRWVPAEQGQCPDADDNALEPTRRGERFPTGQQFPPAHPGCRCLLAIVNDGRSAERRSERSTERRAANVEHGPD